MPPGGLWPALWIVTMCALTLFAGAARTSTVRHDTYPLHVGSSGLRVDGLQWMLGGHCPNKMARGCGGKVKATYLKAPSGYFGDYTGKAVIAWKYRVGYPKAGECGEGRTLLKPIAGRYFIALLRGWRQRPTCWVALAAKRIQLAASGITELALKIKALEVSQLGVTESPLGSNRGPRISYPVNGVPSYQSSTGAYGAAWCVSAQQWSFNRAGAGYFANRTAGVFYTVDWARQRGYLNAKAKVGALVAFLDYQGHMGFVARVTASGFSSIEGNHNQRVAEVWHYYGSRRYVFIYVPHVA